MKIEDFDPDDFICNTGRYRDYLVRLAQQDIEQAHGEEDSIMRAVILTIANGWTTPMSLAKAAAYVIDTDIPRYCS